MKSSAKFVLLLSVATFTLIGCRRSSEPTPPPAVRFDEGPTLEFLADDGEVCVSLDGELAGEKVLLADDVLRPSTATFSLTMHSLKGQFVTFRVSLPVDQVREFYLGELPKNGWEVEAESRTGQTVAIIAGKQGRKLMIYADGVGDTTDVALEHRDLGDA